MKSEVVGTFVDAVYAIAITILALEIPGELGGEFSVADFVAVTLEYCLAFILLFSFWLQHRRISGASETVPRSGLWLNAIVLLCVCLIPRATTLVFVHGGNVTLAQLEGTFFGGVQMTTAELVDLFYVGIVVTADLSLLALAAHVVRKPKPADPHPLWRSKLTTTVLVVLAATASLVLPVNNRFFLLLLPLALFFELQIDRFVTRMRTGSAAVG